MKLSVIPTANAGFLLSDGRATFLIDSIFDRQDEWVSGPDEILLSDMLASRPPFSNLSAILTTHLHPDHGDLALYRRLTNKTIPVVVPDTAGQRDALDSLQNPLTLLRDTADGSAPTLQFGTTRVVALRSEHDGGAPYRIEHYSFIIDFPCGSVFVMGDAASDGELLIQRLGDEIRLRWKMKAAFLNYPEAGRKSGRALISGLLKPDTLFLCHLKKPDEDIHGGIAMTRNRVTQYAAELPETILFDGAWKEYSI
jgi:L-ascorbate metabolism protein UlaG (beta-lactamase superfamily)